VTGDSNFACTGILWSRDDLGSNRKLSISWSLKFGMYSMWAGADLSQNELESYRFACILSALEKLNEKVPGKVWSWAALNA